MSVENLKNLIPDYAKDIRLNLGSVLSTGSQGLDTKQIHVIALASAYSTKNATIAKELEEAAKEHISDEELNSAKSAASIMAMNNIYYRFVHMVSDQEYGKMQAGLRMQVIGKPGIDKETFEMMTLAVSAINGCGMCIDSHVAQLVKAGISKQAIQSVIKIASVVNATAQVIEIGN